MGIVTCNERLARLVALYASPERIKKAIEETSVALQAAGISDEKPPTGFNPSEDSPIGKRFMAEFNDITSIAVREDGLVEWIKSIPAVAKIAKDETHRDHAEAAKSLAFFKRFAATLDWRALL